MDQHHSAPSHSHPLSMDIHLLYQPLGVVNAVTRWVSEESMQIDTGCVTLQRLSEVEIAFPHQHDSNTIYYRIKAHVSHHSDGRAILRFIRCSRAAHQALQELIAHHH